MICSKALSRYFRNILRWRSPKNSILQSAFRSAFSLLLATCLFQPVISEAWIVRGSEDFNVSPHCRPEVLRDELAYHFKKSAGLSDSLNNPRVWASLENKLQKYFDLCGDELDGGNVAKIIDYAELELLEYDYRSHPDFRPVTFTLPESSTGENLKYRGYLGLKPGGVRRPLVIFQCGLGCDSGDAALRQMAIMFFDMGPFHVLLMPSNSSEHFVKENKIFAVGGLQEGRQLVKIAQLIESGAWPYSKYVSKIHLFGTSLGGHSSYYAAAYADHLPNRRDPLFATVAVGCPVVDLKSSLEHITSSAFIAKLVRKAVLGNVAKVLSFVPFFDPWISGQPESYKPSQQELREMFVSGTQDFYERRLSSADWALPPFENYGVDRSKQFWTNLDSSTSVIPELSRPIFSWAPKDDDIVLYESNSKVAYRADLPNGPHRKIYKLETEAGGHCAFPSRYGWQASSVVFNSVFESRSPELLSQRRFRKVKIPDHLLPHGARASGRNWRIRSQWIASPGKDYVELRTFFHQKFSRDRNRSTSIHRSREDVSVRVPVKLLGLSKRAFLKTDIEAQSFTRWLNSRITLENSSGARIGQTDNPSYFKILEYKKR